MCGIITIIRKDKRCANQMLFKGYEKQKARGQQGFGFVSFDDSKLNQLKRTENWNDMKVLLEKDESTGIFFHHRYPTSTPNYRELAHPITVKNKGLKHNYYVVHNGIITNEDELRTKHESEGYEYTTICKNIVETYTTRYSSECFNDSESLAIELAKAIDTGKTDVADVRGSIAFMVIQADKKDNIQAVYFGRNTGNTLYLDDSKDFIRVASEGQGTLLDTDTLYKLDIKSKEIKTSDFRVGYTVSSTWSDYRYSDKGYSSHSTDSSYSSYSDDEDKDNIKYLNAKNGGYDDDYEKYDYLTNYEFMPKNQNGTVWLSGDEDEEKLGLLWNRYDAELEKAKASCTLDKVEEYQLRLMEVENAFEEMYETGKY